MKRNYPENRSRFTETEDAKLLSMSEQGYTCAAIAEALDRPVGSIYTRRRLLGVSEKRGPNRRTIDPTEYAQAEYMASEYGETPVLINPEVDELIGRIAFYSFAGALALAAVFAIAGGW